MRHAGVLVIGGGPAGSIVALELARAGHEALLLEKSKEPHHKVCGEFLSGDTLHYLHRHGIHPEAMGAVTLRSVRLVLRNSVVERPLPFLAVSLTRCVLDEALLLRAANAGVQVLRGASVEALTPHGDIWHAGLRDRDSISSREVFLATGKHDLRGWPRPAGTHRGLIAFKMYYQLAPEQYAALGNSIELVLFPGGYLGLQPVEGGRVNACLLITAEQRNLVGGGWPQLEAYLKHTVAHLQTRLRGATACLGAPLAASHLPYGHLQGSAPAGLWHVGDQAAVIPSFCGDGMAIALHSGALAADHYLREAGTERYRLQLRKHLRLRLRFATELSRMLVSSPGVAELARLVPALLTGIARFTRIPQSALIGRGE